MANPGSKKNLVIRCSQCGHDNEFHQPYRYHSGFGDQGFLYNEAGNSTLTWNAYDPFFSKLFPGMMPWNLTSAQKQHLESILPLSPNGDHWLFSAPARCINCKSPISMPQKKDIYYVLYPHSIKLSGPDQQFWMEWYVRPAENK